MDKYSRDELISIAKYAEQAERYDDMQEAMCLVVKQGKLTPEERNFLSVAYKNVVGARRSAWRVLQSLESKGGSSEELLKGYKAKVEEELKKHCNEVIALLQDNIITNDDYKSDDEAMVFFLKMKGDYYRYITEILRDDERKEYADLADVAYQEAVKIASSEEEGKGLPKTSPVRLGLILNYSVFYYEIMGKVKVACELAKKAFDNAVAELDSMKEENYKDSTLILQLLRDNLTLWTSEQDEQDTEDAD